MDQASNLPQPCLLREGVWRHSLHPWQVRYFLNISVLTSLEAFQFPSHLLSFNLPPILLRQNSPSMITMLPFGSLALFLATVFNISAVHALSFAPLSFQSGSISFTDWISLLTLCFAPLIAHIIAGVPKATILHSARPGWLDRLTLFNPMSIMWRYFAIADRRLRSRRGTWTPTQTAAANAAFWTKNGWNGSEIMILSARHFIVDLPKKSHVRLLSASTLKTTIVTLQGIQAIWVLSSGITQLTNGFIDSSIRSGLAIDTLFGPLAVMGLLRLSAAFWLTEDYAYSYKYLSQEEKQKLQNHINASPPNRLRPTSDWRSRIFRLFYFSAIALLWTMLILFWVPDLRHWISQAPNSVENTPLLSLYILSFYYLFLLTPPMLMFAFYFIRGRCTTTMIPCISSTWYKIYTVILGLATVFVIIMAAITTRVTVCGRSTMWPSSFVSMELALCPSLQFMNSSDSSGPFGLVTRSQNETSKLPAGDFRVVEFTGYFQGYMGAAYAAAFLDNSTYLD